MTLVICFTLLEQIVVYIVSRYGVTKHTSVKNSAVNILEALQVSWNVFS